MRIYILVLYIKHIWSNNTFIRIMSHIDNTLTQYLYMYCIPKKNVTYKYIDNVHERKEKKCLYTLYDVCSNHVASPCILKCQEGSTWCTLHNMLYNTNNNNIDICKEIYKDILKKAKIQYKKENKMSTHILSQNHYNITLGRLSILQQDKLDLKRTLLKCGSLSSPSTNRQTMRRQAILRNVAATAILKIENVIPHNSQKEQLLTLASLSLHTGVNIPTD